MVGLVEAVSSPFSLVGKAFELLAKTYKNPWEFVFDLFYRFIEGCLKLFDSVVKALCRILNSLLTFFKGLWKSFLS